MSDSFILSTLHVSTARTWRGGENQILLLCKGLAAKGVRACIAAPKDTPLLQRAQEAGIPTETLTLRGEADPVGTLRLARLLRRLKPDILHLHDGHAVLPGQIAARSLPRKKLAVIAHRRTVFPLKSRWKYGGRVDRVIAISAAAKAQVVAGGIPAERVAVVYSGLDFPTPLPKDHPDVLTLREELGLPANAFLVAHAAALSAEKRQADLLAAIAAISSQDISGKALAPSEKSVMDAKSSSGRSVHLAIAGKGELEDALRAQARSLGISERVHFLGFKRNLQPLWSAADAACFCSEAEGLCTALVEAQGAGLAAVVTRAGGMVEVVEDGASGAIIEIGDIEAMARELKRLAGDEALARRQALAAAERARRHFTAEAMTEGILQVYRDAAGKPMQRDRAAT